MLLAWAYPLFLLHKQDSVVLPRQMEPEERFPITWDMSEDAEGELSE